MPGMSGGELAEKVTELLPEIRVLFMSGYTDDILDEQHHHEAQRFIVGDSLRPLGVMRALNRQRMRLGQFVKGHQYFYKLGHLIEIDHIGTV